MNVDDAIDILERRVAPPDAPIPQCTRTQVPVQA